MNNIGNLSEDECCGCGLCAYKCPVSAIELKYNNEGFIYPFVNVKCVECGKCLQVCSQRIYKDRLLVEIKNEYVAYSKLIEEIETSASGAIASELYKMFIHNGGYVVGAKWHSSMDGRLRYVITNDRKEIRALKGSKYVQAEKNEIYYEVEKIAREGYKILIIGLPCEVAAFKKAFEMHDSNIYYCDLICFGPTSTGLLRDFLTRITTTYKSQINEFHMRYKINKKERPFFYVKFCNGKEYLRPLYQTDIGLAFTAFGRKNCEHCMFQFRNSVADITIGDYITSCNDDFYNETGISRIIIHTEKGQKLFDKLNGKIIYKQTEGFSEKLYSSRKQRINDEERELFSKDYIKNGMKFAVRKKFGIIRRKINEWRNR